MSPDSPGTSGGADPGTEVPDAGAKSGKDPR